MNVDLLVGAPLIRRRYNVGEANAPITVNVRLKVVAPGRSRLLFSLDREQPKKVVAKIKQAPPRHVLSFAITVSDIEF